MVHARTRHNTNDGTRLYRILHMEDDAGLARLVRKRLPRERYHVDLATDGEQGMAMHAASSYDLLLLDHYMPVYNGLDVLRALSVKGPLPPTIVITGRGDEKLAVEAMKLGASDYVVKDREGDFLDLLPTLIEKALAHHRLQQENLRSQAALREREELLRLISDALPVCISYMDSDQRYLFANKTFEQWFNRPVPDIIGRPFGEIWGESAQHKVQEHVPAILEGRTVRYEDEIVSRDGSTRYISVTHVPHMDDCDMMKGCVSLMSDITLRRRSEEALRGARDELEDRVNQRTEQLAESNEKLRVEIQVRKRAEAELRASEERFRAIFEAAQDCIVVKDRALRYTQANPAMANLLGIPVSEIVGKKSADLFEPDTSQQIEAVDLRVLDGQSIEHTVTRWIGSELVTFHDVKVPLRDASGKIVGLCGIAREVTGLKRPQRSPVHPSEECRSPTMKRTIARAMSAAHSDSTVLLLGESGSGKDYLARYIHDNSGRSAGPFFSVNCAAVAAELAEAELFGHEAGAFSGAARRKRGLLELAEGGTLLLNEIGDLPLAQQAKLLSFLDTRTLTRVGGETSIRVNARIIAATNCDLDKEVKEGRFRLDLFYRLNVLTITIPPLRERLEDLPLLVDRIVDKLAEDMQLHGIPALDDRALRTLAEYDWPGNVRQLRNVIERALILCRDDGSSISFDPLLPRESTQGDWSFTVRLPGRGSVNEVANEVKRALIAETLARCQGNKQVAAQRLGISRFALFRMMKSLTMSED
jgi:PAS domain S-box-containing protein